MMRNWLMWVPLALLAFVAGLSLYRLSNPGSNIVQSQMVGQQLPDFTLPAAAPGLAGLSSKDFADGKPRMLNIFASWCIPCRAEAPYLEQLRARGIEIHGIAIKDKPEDVVGFLRQYGNPFSKVGADMDMLVQLKLGSSGVPETYIIDGKGRIVHQHIGDINADHVIALIEKLAAAK
jgi:cytochrome c biogenesis protein CcmG, thiol:disulfide interchange protein DsbE